MDCKYALPSFLRFSYPNLLLFSEPVIFRNLYNIFLASKLLLFKEKSVVVSHIQRIGCQPEKNYFTQWPIPLVVC